MTNPRDQDLERKLHGVAPVELQASLHANEPVPAGKCPRCRRTFGAEPFCPYDGTLKARDQVLGERYVLEELLGAGGMGFVFAGRHQLLNKPVAIKVLRAELCADAHQVARFMREAQLCSQLRHENIVDVTDFGRDAGGSIFLVMEHLVGANVDEVLTHHGPLHLRRALLVLRQLCRALDSAHALGVIHRDLKPRNIFITEASGRRGIVKLLDFGISRMVSGDNRITSTGQAIGTAIYMSPEQLRGEAQDHRVDIYALGVVAYELLTGELPFKSDNQAQLTAEKLLGEPPDLRQTELAAACPVIAELIQECLAVDPNRRPASAAEFEQRLLSGYGSALDQVEDLEGVRAGSYRLVRLLGAGGIGSVWLGEHPVIGSKVAVKFLHPELCENAEAVRRFVTEAQAVNRIESPHIVKTFDFGKLPDGRDFSVMELLGDETLATRMALQPRPSWQWTREIMMQLARALGSAHRAGIVHRDIKPENVHIESGVGGEVVKVVDFGIAKLLEGDVATTHRTKLGMVMGTPLFAAPEQVEGIDVGPPADIYALGAVLYEMLTGRLPFVGTLREVLTAKTACAAPSLATLRPDLAEGLVALVDAMLERDPARRPTADVLEATLEALEDAAGDNETLAAVGSEATAGVTGPPEAERGAEEKRTPVSQTLLGVGVPTPAPTAVATPSPEPAQPVTRSRFWIGLALISMLLGAAGTWWVARPRPGIAPTRPARTSKATRSVGASAQVQEEQGAQTSTSAPAPRPAPPSASTSVPVTAPTPAPTSVPTPAPSTPLNKGRATVAKKAPRMLVVRSTPPGASVWRGKKRLGRTPVELGLDSSGASLTLTLRKRGYRTISRQVSARQKIFSVVMRRKKRARKGKELERPRRKPPSKLRDPFDD